MAKNKVEIDVKVDDRGTTKKVGLGAKKAASNLDAAAKASRTADRNLKGAAQASANGTKNFSKMAQGISGGLVPAYATLAANVFAISAAFNFLKSAADFRVITDSQIAFSSATGVGIRSISKDLQKASGDLISFTEASSAAAIGVSSGLSSSQLKGFAEGAQNVSVILGRDVTDSFNRLIRGVTKAEPELLDELGIILRLTTATENYAGMLNKSVKDLTLFEKSQAVAVEVQSQLDKKYGNVADAVELQGNAVAKLGIAFEKVLNPIKEVTAIFAEPTAKFLAENIGSLAAALGFLAIPIIKAVLPAMDEWEDKTRKATDKIKQDLEDTTNSIKELEDAQARLAVAGKDPGVAATQAVEGVKSKSTGILKLQQGQYQALTKREISGLLTQAKKGQGAVTQMSKKMQAQYIAALKKMQGSTNSSFSAMRNQMSMLFNWVSIRTKRMEVRWSQAMLAMKVATKGFVAGVNKLMKGLGIIGVALMLKDLAMTGAKAMGVFKDDDATIATAEALEELAGRLKNTTKEFKLFAKIQEDFAKKGSGRTLESVEAVSSYISTQGGVFADIASKYQELKPLMDEGGVLTTGGKMLTNQADNAGTLRDLMEKSQEAAKGFVVSLEAANAASTPLGKELYDLAQVLAKENGIQALSDEQLERFQELLKYFGEVGQKANLLQQKEVSINEQYRRRVASITQFSTSVTSLIEEIKGTLELEKEVTSENEERVAAYKTQLAFLEKIRDVEVDRILAAKRLKVQEERSKRVNIGGFSVGVTSGLAEELARRRAAQKAQDDLTAAEQKLALAQSPEVTEKDKAKIEELQLTVEAAAFALENLNAELSESNRFITDLGQGFEDSFTSAFEGIITGTTSVKDAFKNMGQSILKMIAQMIAKMIAFRIVSAIFGAFTPPASMTSVGGIDAQSGVAGGMPTQVSFLNEDGMVGSFSTPSGRTGGMFEKVPGYSTGGIARGRDAGYPAILHGTEAVVPLPNGKSIPVEMGKGMGQSNNVVVNVNVDSNGNAQQNTQGDQGGMNLGNAIAEAVQKELQNQKRSGGILNPYGVA